MKAFRKLATLISAGVLCLALASCGMVVPSTNLEVDPATGAGKASFTMVVPKNGVDGVGNNYAVFDESGKNVNQGYIVSNDKLLALLKSKVPAGFTVTMKEQTKMVDVENEETGEVDTKDQGSFDFTVTFSFSSIADYNAKIKQWLPEKYWTAAKETLGAAEAIKEAAIATTGEATAADVTLTVDMRILDVVCQWVYDIASTDTTGAVIDGGNGWQYPYVYNMDKGSYTISLGGKNTTKPYSNTKPEISVKATGVDTTAKAPSTPTSPSTGDPLAVSAIAVTVLAGGALMLLKKRK